MSLGAPELLIILAVVMLLFGAKKVPDLAKSLGQAKREFDHGSRDDVVGAPVETVPTPVQAVRTTVEADVDRRP